MFVTTAFLDRFNEGLSGHIVRTIMLVTETEPGSSSSGKHSADSACPLACVLGAAQDICASTFVEDEESLEQMLEVIYRQFEVAEDCNETDRALALQNLEQVFLLASEDARGALQEVKDGFPTSRGDFAAWKHKRFWREHRKDSEAARA